MRVAFLYNRSSEDPANSAEDDVPARSPVAGALRRLGHGVSPIACSLNLASARRRLERCQPDVVFNRVESLAGSDSMMAAVTLLLDAMGLPYTGNPTQAMVAAANKLTVKEQLVRAGLPTPDWITSDGESIGNPQSQIRNPQFILKSVLEHASFEISDGSIVGPAATDAIAKMIQRRAQQAGRPFFAERFVEGREFNLSLLGDGPQVLPPAEIDFSAFPPGKPHIVGQRAKWDGSAFEFHNTPRRYDFPHADEPLIRQLTELAVECWRLFGLRGYARVDFRCDSAAQPWILEINTNPCIAPTSGFAAALEQAGISYDDGIQHIIDDALARHAPSAHRKKHADRAAPVTRLSPID
jgi:D-alanine-D-alanine ligase